jgi:Pyruvate kinase, barrel domain
VRAMHFGVQARQLTRSTRVCSCSYKKLAEDVKVGSQILCADGSIVLEVLETDPKAGTVRCMCRNNASLGCGPWLASSHTCDVLWLSFQTNVCVSRPQLPPHRSSHARPNRFFAEPALECDLLPFPSLCHHLPAAGCCLFLGCHRGTCWPIDLPIPPQSKETPRPFWISFNVDS